MITYGLREENWAFCTDPTWKTRKLPFLDAARRRAHRIGRRAPEAQGGMYQAHAAAPPAEILVFSSCFRSFFRLETLRNLKWIFFTLNCLQKPSKNH